MAEELFCFSRKTAPSRRGWFPGGGFPGRITMECSYMRSCRLVHLLYLYNDETCRLAVEISSNLTIYCRPASLVLYRQMKHCSNQLAEGFKIQLSRGV